MKALASFSIVLTIIVSSLRIDASLAHVQLEERFFLVDGFAYEPVTKATV